MCSYTKFHVIFVKLSKFQAKKEQQHLVKVLCLQIKCILPRIMQGVQYYVTLLGLCWGVVSHHRLGPGPGANHRQLGSDDWLCRMSAKATTNEGFSRLVL